MPEHTPGPWRFKTDGSYVRLLRADGSLVCDWDTRGRSDPPKLPDQDLIAQAPTLTAKLAAVEAERDRLREACINMRDESRRLGCTFCVFDLTRGRHQDRCPVGVIEAALETKP